MSSRLLVVLSTVFKVRGGIPRFNQMLCRAIDELAPELGIEATVISQDDTAEDYRRAGSPWRNLEFVAGGGPLRLAWRSLRASLRERPDLMLIGLLGMTPVGVLCKPLLRGGFGFVAHGIEVWDEPRISRRLAGRQASFAFAVSRHTAGSVERTLGLPAAAIRRLPNTLDPAFEASRVEPGAEGNLELLTVSRLWKSEERKGVDNALEAFARVAGGHPKAVYRIVGEGTDKPRLQGLAESLGLGDRVIFEEHLSDEELAARYGRCAAFVLPSGQEGFGIVFLEAMRFGKPCVGGDAGGTPDVIVDGETGYLVPYGDVEALAAVMDRLLGDPGERRRLGLGGQMRLEAEFTFPRYRERLGRHLAELLGRTGS
jgi:glycosyltransferase involved in cell wall biosynthesis